MSSVNLAKKVNNMLRKASLQYGKEEARIMGYLFSFYLGTFFFTISQAKQV